LSVDASRDNAQIKDAVVTALGILTCIAFTHKSLTLMMSCPDLKKRNDIAYIFTTFEFSINLLKQIRSK